MVAGWLRPCAAAGFPSIEAVRILITGARGQLGSDLRRLLPEAVGLGRAELAIDDEAAVARAFAEVRPELVYNCAAYNGVDQAEAEPEVAARVNALGPEILARACAERGARLVHFSTNFVFDGALERPYVESDAPGPLSVYARSKLDGERAVLDVLPGALVARVTSLFGVEGSAIKGGSFPERVIRSAREGRPLRIVADQFVNPTYTGDLAAAVVGVVESGLEGLVHLAPEDCCSWYEFATEALLVAGLGESSGGVEAITTGELGAAAPRPLRTCLASERVPALRPWREGLRAWWEALGAR